MKVHELLRVYGYGASSVKNVNVIVVGTKTRTYATPEIVPLELEDILDPVTGSNPDVSENAWALLCAVRFFMVSTDGTMNILAAEEKA